MVPDVPCVPGIGTRCSRNRTKHDGNARGKDQNFTHIWLRLLCLQLVAGITPRAPTGFRCVPVTQISALGIGKAYGLTGPQSRDMPGIAAEYAA
jgi:hypothetical protein